ALKKGTSFEYVSENRMFSGSDGYTLTITFPLKDCPQNIAIFGHINRADVIAQRCIFNCEIRDKNFYKFGCITVTEINESEVKTQFLDGRSEQNFNVTFDDIYINELDLGSGTGCNDSTPSNAWNPRLSDMKCVALPWVNDYSGNIQNLADYHAEERNNDGSLKANAYFSWNSECRGRSWQPYLLYIVRKICEAVGYTSDFSAWEEDEKYKYLLICNTLPYAWDTGGFARALPHWTVAEFFEKLELFLGGEFTINHRSKHIDFAFTEDTLASLPPVRLDNVVDEHTTEVTVEDDKCEYQEAKNLVYKECDHEMWKFYSCDWFIKAWKSGAKRYGSMRELLQDNAWLATWNGSSQRGSNRDKLLYAEDIDCYFIVRSLSKELVEKRGGWMPNLYKYKMELRPVNLFGGRIVDDSEDADEIEIEFVPAWIDETEDKYGRLLFLSFSGYDDNDSTSTSWSRDPNTRKQEIDNTLYQPIAFQSLSAGEKTKKAEYYDRIYVAWWDGAWTASSYQLPHPYAEDIEIMPDWSNFRSVHFNLRISDRSIGSKYASRQIETNQKTTFKFLSDTIPDVRAIFYIKGKRYICEKLTSTFTENGKSDLVKGVFYPIKD
ncbi:MAG: hypothetical protein NC230_08990, partial [Bacteroides sp.]|nr:hypothetical protein [Bacteroides sp.]